MKHPVLKQNLDRRFQERKHFCIPRTRPGRVRNIKSGKRKGGREIVNWIQLAQRLMNTVLEIRFP
jgi:hypothetical protein